jgi:hypothetical protein
MYATFPIIIFFIGAAVLVGLPLASTLQSYFKNRGRRQVVCPDDHQRVEVEVDPKFALQAAMRGRDESRVQTCTHWPERSECEQECLAQVEATPYSLELLFKKWFKGKRCTICSRTLTPSDWRFGRMGFLNEEFKLIELRQLDFTELGSMDEPKRPLCWTCHQQEKQRQAAPMHIGWVGDKLKA